jgi:membrane protease YdiL (CAAX protease family)
MKIKITLKQWCLIGVLACAGFLAWWRIEYPHLIFMDLSVKKQEAMATAQSYLSGRGVRCADYSKTIILKTDDWADRYLQRTVGISAEEDFFRRHHFEIFSWQVRFFREQQKEEYRVNISPASGQVIKFDHYIEDTEPRPQVNKEEARAQAWEFLSRNFGWDPLEYDFHQENIKRYDKRIDYSFSWEKKGVYIPWQGHKGGAKLLTEVTISGKEIRVFNKNKFDIPDEFNRYVEDQFTLGEFLYAVGFLLLIILLVSSVFILVIRKDSPVIRAVSRWYYLVFGAYFLVSCIEVINNLPREIMLYRTGVKMSSYLGNHLFQMLIKTIFISASFVIPALAGESLLCEGQKRRPHNTFFHYIRSSFFNRSLSVSVIVGYLLFVIMAGLQAVIFYFGQKYCGVWKEWLRLTEFSSAFLPVIGALAIGFTASIREELVYRFFGIAILRKYLGRQWLAIILISLVWGLGHSTYAIFPVWFRVLEITLIGSFLGCAYLRFGLVAVIVAHYLFDVFISTSAYLFGHSQLQVFASAGAALAAPLIVAIAAWVMNRSEDESDMRLLLNPIQQYNLGILEVFIAKKTAQGAPHDAVKNELIRNNWDPALVELAVSRVQELSRK